MKSEFEALDEIIERQKINLSPNDIRTLNNAVKFMTQPRDMGKMVTDYASKKLEGACIENFNRGKGNDCTNWDETLKDAGKCALVAAGSVLFARFIGEVFK